MGNNDIPPPPPGWAIVPADDPRLKNLPCQPLVWAKDGTWIESPHDFIGDSIPDDCIELFEYALPCEKRSIGELLIDHMKKDYLGNNDKKTKSAVAPLDRQEGGSHYKDCTIQPVEFITANKLNFLEGCVIKRICRHRRKNGAEDIRKAIHELELLLALEYPQP